MISSPDTDKIIPALVAALNQMSDIPKTHKADIPTKTGGKYTYTFADLKDVLSYLRPVLKEHGLAVFQMAYTDTGTAVATTLLHESGQWIESPPLRLPSGQDAQSHGSSITFGRRYSLMALCGLATEDDDGGAASRSHAAASAPKADKPASAPSQAVTKRVMAMFAEAGITDRNVRLQFTSTALNRPVASWSEVNASEAHTVMDVLDRLIKGQLSVVYLDDGGMSIERAA
jgi:hypothetical protein